jgi:hypothetical protein
VKVGWQEPALVWAGLLVVSSAVACRQEAKPVVALQTSPAVTTSTPSSTPVAQPLQGRAASGFFVVKESAPQPEETVVPSPTAISSVPLDDHTVDKVICGFESLLDLAATPATYDAFKQATDAACGVFAGGDVSDAAAVLPCFTCTLQVEGAEGRYFFFPDAAGEVATLQQARITSPWLDGVWVAGGPGAGVSEPARSLRHTVDALADALAPGASVHSVPNLTTPQRQEEPGVLALQGEMWALHSLGGWGWLSVRRWETGDSLLLRYWESAGDGQSPWRLDVVWRRAPLKQIEAAWEADRPEYPRRFDLGPQDWRLGEQVFHYERLYPSQAFEACREAGLKKCDQGRLGIEKMDETLLKSPLDEAVDSLKRLRDPLDNPPLVFWVDQLAVATGLASETASFAKRREALVAAGLTFDYVYCGEEYELRRNLLERLALERQDTYWGQLAFQAMSWRGWEVKGDCPGGAFWEGDDVINRGEAFLGKHPESPVRDQVTFHVARAYEAWWALSHRRDDDGYVQAACFQPGADEARRKAIVYYRLYLDRKKDLPEIQRTWLRQKLFRLEHGLDTWQWFYFCICD